MRTKQREIPKKNYLIFSVIVFFTLAVTITSYVIYENNKEYQNSIPVIRGSASEIEAKDLDEFLIENENALLYFGVAKDKNSREVEEGLVKLISKRDLKVIYVNLSNVEDKEKFYLSFNEKYTTNENIKLNNYPAFAIFKGGRVIDLVEKKENFLYIGDIEQLIDIYEIKGEAND